MAIAFLGSGDAGDTGGSTGGHSATVNIPSGTNILIIYAYTGSAVGSFSPPNAGTVAGNSMTSCGTPPTGEQNSGWGSMFLYLSPPSGNQTVAVSGATGAVTGFQWAAYSGAKQSGQPDSYGVTNSGTGANMVVSTTVVASNSWLVGGQINQGSQPSTPTIRAYALRTSGGGQVLGDSNGTVGTGSQSLTFTLANSWRNGLVISIAPTTTAAPTVTTQAVSSIGTTTATGNGNVTSDGGATVTERGVCVGTSANPTTANDKFTAAAGGTGAYTASITGRTRGTLYHVRAYAINSIGTSYGADVEFTTTDPQTISGIVSLSGVPVEGATVRCIVQSDNTILAEQTTDASGAYEFADLDSAELYHLAVEYTTGGIKYNALSLWDIVPYEVP